MWVFITLSSKRAEKIIFNMTLLDLLKANNISRKNKLKLLTQRFIGSFHRKQRSWDKNIFLFSTPRSGSTFLMNLFGTQQGIRCISEPLNINKEVPPVRKERYIDSDLSPTEKKLIKEHLSLIITGKKFRISWKDIRYGKLFHSSRVTLKLTRATHLIEWFLKNFEGHYIYLIRHPIPTCLSQMRMGLSPPIKEYLQSSTFGKKDLIPLTLDLIQKTSGRLEKYVIGWCLDNALPLKKFQTHKRILFLRYEDLVLTPHREISRFDAMELPAPTAMLKEIQVPSSSSQTVNPEKLDAIKRGDKEYLIYESWKEKVTRKEIYNVRQILKNFNVHLYRDELTYDA